MANSPGASDSGGERRRSAPIRLVQTHLIPTAAAFMRTEAAGGVVLLVAVVIAMAWANSPFKDAYFDLWNESITLGFGSLSVETDLHHIVNDGLMTVFFYVVGLEIKRELIEGELRRPRQALLPVAGAAGGMALPALLYASINIGGEGTDGWGIPVATDIAMAVGVMALLGPRVHPGIKVFLLALAIVDDLGGILIIALFYSAGLSFGALAVAGGLLGVIVLLRQLHVRVAPVYAVLAAGFWLAVLESGVHATIAGVILAFLTSAGSREEVGESALDRMEQLLHPWASFLVIPIFALANGGIEVTRDAIDGAVNGEIAPGIALGLLVGKPAGILVSSFLVVTLGLASLPEGSNWRQIAGAGMLGGIGFTVSIFIAGLAFEDGGLVEQAKMGILVASVAAGVAGYAWLRLCCPASAPMLTAPVAGDVEAGVVDGGGSP
ncbi:MAG: Na+/H+ antiporter NhaA [Tepidiformaceae bacterium]